MNDSQYIIIAHHNKWRTAHPCDALHCRLQISWKMIAIRLDQCDHRVGCAFADGCSIEVNSAHARLRGERDEVHSSGASSLDPMTRPRKPNFSLARTTIERPSGVSSAREASCAASARSCTATPLTG